jgi:hypothetical protein
MKNIQKLRVPILLSSMVNTSVSHDKINQVTVSNVIMTNVLIRQHAETKHKAIAVKYDPLLLNLNLVLC